MKLVLEKSAPVATGHVTTVGKSFNLQTLLSKFSNNNQQELPAELRKVLSGVWMRLLTWEQYDENRHQ
jgi:hypothetical protein